MAHNITATDSLSYRRAGGIPWHGLGTPIDDGRTAVEIVQDPASGIGWTHELMPVEAILPDGTRVTVPDRKADVRSDTRTVLGVVGADYQTVQNHELAEFADALAGPDAVASVETFGSLGGGRTVFVAMRMPGGFSIDGDESRQYVLVTNGNGGTGSLSFIDTAVRAVCANTVGLANSELGTRGARFVHKGNMGEKVRQARVILGLARERFAHFAEQAKAMAQCGLTEADARGFFESAFVETFGGAPTEDEARARWLARRDARVQEWLAMMENERNALPGVRGTVWAAFNAFTEWSDHVRGGAKRTREDRMEANVLGGAAQDKRNVLRIARTLAGV